MTTYSFVFSRQFSWSDFLLLFYHSTEQHLFIQIFITYFSFWVQVGSLLRQGAYFHIKWLCHWRKSHKLEEDVIHPEVRNKS